MSACVNARSVCVRTFPRAPLLNPSAVMEMSSGASTIATMSYSPSVQKESLTVAPHFFAISLKARLGPGAKMPFGIHPHMLRHSTGFKLANQGVDTRSLQHYLGHKNIQHTVRYTELTPERFRDFWKD